MTQAVGTIYKSSRQQAGIPLEKVNIPVSERQLLRYESENDKTKPTSEIVKRMTEEYGDKYLGYQHLKQNNPVAMMFIPENVPKCTLLEATAKLVLAIKEFQKYTDPMLAISVDGKITEDEVHRWLALKNRLEDIISAYIALECADGDL